jgi:hypothetical protein
MSGETSARILIVLSRGSKADDREFEQFVAVYYVLRDSGADVVVASVDGGYPWTTRAKRGVQVAGGLAQRFQADGHARDDVANTLQFRQVYVEDFDGGFCIGSPGAIWRTDDDDSADALIVGFLRAGKPVVVLSSLVDITPKGAGQGLLIIGDGDWPPPRAVRALMAAVSPIRTGKELPNDD